MSYAFELCLQRSYDGINPSVFIAQTNRRNRTDQWTMKVIKAVTATESYEGSNQELHSPKILHIPQAHCERMSTDRNQGDR